MRFVPAGDKAFVIELGTGISPEINRSVQNLLLAIEKQGIPGVLDMVPTYRSLLNQLRPVDPASG